MFRMLAIVLALVCAGTASADEKLIRKVVSEKLSGATIDGIQPAPMPGLWEVRFRTQEGPRIIYTDARAHYIVLGSLYDTRSDRNVTEERLQKLLAIKFDELPLDLAVKITRGNGRRTLVMFSDPYCPACKSFEQELARIDDITIHVFMYPVIRPELGDHSKSVWCSKDRAKAWLDLALRGRPPVVNATCDTPIDRILALGRKLGVNSTPTLFLVSGERLRGGVPADRLVEMLDETAKTARRN